MSETRTRCTVRDGKFVDPCASLAEATEISAPRGHKKGVFAWAYSDRNGPTRTMFGVKSGAWAQDGFLFNFCPFCGEEIDAPFAANSDGETKA